MKRFIAALSLAATLLYGGLLGAIVAAPASALAGCPSGDVQVTIQVPGSVSATDDHGNTIYCVPNDSSNGGAIITYAKGIIKFLGGLVGLVVVLMIIVAGVQYILANGDPKAVASAKNRIVNAIIALILYILMFGILQYLIPGGIFS